MPEISMGAGPHCITFNGRKLAREHIHDWLILLMLVIIDICLNLVEPFHRYVAADMMTDLKYPFYEKDSIPMYAVPVYAILFPCVIFIVYFTHRRDVYDLHYAVLGTFYSALVTAVITDSIKDAVGRPRPNFFYRCFPDGVPAFKRNGDVMCTGHHKFIKEGYKSFPSGHTSWSFAGLGFLSWYLSGKIQVFDQRGHIAKLCIVLFPYLFAALVGVSRVDDYWHHWTDVFAGAIIGTIVSAVCYLQFFPLPHHRNGCTPHATYRALEKLGGQHSSPETLGHEYVLESREYRDNNSADLEALEDGRRD